MVIRRSFVIEKLK